MTSRIAVVLLCTLALTACPGGGGGDNEITPGLRVSFAEVHMESQGDGGHHAARAAEAPVVPKHGGHGGGYNHDGLDHHHAHDKNGVSLSLYRIYLVIDNMQLVQCASLARLPDRLLGGVLGLAYAHGGHGGDPVGGRGLDKPNVIDLMARDDVTLPLGNAAVQPGRYCGVRFSLVRLAGGAYGKPVFVADEGDPPVPGHPDIAGKAYAIKADYCSERGLPTPTSPNGPCVARTTADIVDDGSAVLPAFIELDFEHPMVLDEAHRTGHVRLGIAYGGWVHDVDVTKLGSDAAERQKAVDAILASVFVHSAGLGPLPDDPEHEEEGGH